MMLTEDVFEKEICVPPGLKTILKEYAKAAVREKPFDLLQWSAAYFRALANNEQRGSKVSLHIFNPCTSGLSLGVLKHLFHKLSNSQVISSEELKALWKDTSLDRYFLLELFSRAGISQEEVTEVNWMKILALCACMGTKDLRDTMKRLIEVVREDEEGRMLFSQAEDMLKFLAQEDGVPPSDVQNALKYLRKTSEKQNGYVLPKNFEDPLFPVI